MVKKGEFTECIGILYKCQPEDLAEGEPRATRRAVRNAVRPGSSRALRLKAQASAQGL